MSRFLLGCRRGTFVYLGAIAWDGVQELLLCTHGSLSLLACETEGEAIIALHLLLFLSANVAPQHMGPNRAGVATLQAW